jgi:hypothetical protein
MKWDVLRQETMIKHKEVDKRLLADMLKKQKHNHVRYGQHLPVPGSQ